MINTIVGDVFDMEETSTALACSNIATSLTAGSAFIIGPNASLRASLLICILALLFIKLSLHNETQDNQVLVELEA